jgi:hypothetical protein
MKVKEWIPRPLVPPLRACRNYVRSRLRGQGVAYNDRVKSELQTFSETQSVYNLPPITHYWSNKHLVPILAPLGFTNAMEMFRMYMVRVCREKMPETCWFLSIGAGDSAPEINMAEWLIENDIHNFVFECLDLNSEVLDRGEQSACAKGLRENFKFTNADVNSWHPARQYMIILAVQALHHFVELEALFDKIDRALHVDGFFLTDDMIGRNGHQRWPEALAFVAEFWKELPEKYTYNHSLKRFEKKYQNWDCSMYGFEGIRAEDIMPLLVKRFHFDLFIGFGNVVDIFVDRSFGPNFDPENEWDRNFIDRVQALDQSELETGRLKPTHIYAALTKKPVAKPKCHKHMTPEFCVRWPDPRSRSLWNLFKNS